jgi:uncharacterized membrane protein HdeD (DUF308 family)
MSMTADRIRHPWWLAYTRAGLSIALGLAVIYWPRIDVPTLVLLCGTYAVADGVMIALIGIRIGSRSMQFAGVSGVVVGWWLLSRPDFSEAAILFAIGVWTTIRGAFDISTSIHLRSEIPDEWVLMSKGVLMLVFGFVMSTSFVMFAEVFPQARAIVLAWMIAAFALVEGALLLALAGQLRLARPRAGLRPSAA